jgi:glutathionyl-hydroquinone reductase
MVLSDMASGADEDEFNRWYNEVHAPEIIERGAAVSFRRFKTSGVRLSPGIPEPDQSYACVYEIEAETVEDVRAIEKLLRETTEQSRGISPTLDLQSVRAAFLVPIDDSGSS